MESRNIEFIPKCIVIGFKRLCDSVKNISEVELFQKFIISNNYCYWNINLKEICDKCELVGHIRPYCLLITGPDICIESLKLAHQKRLLKAPGKFVILYLGNVDSITCQSIIPSQFVSLDEALCYVIFDLNIRNEMSSFDVICCRLAEWYPDLQLPPHFLILSTLRHLIDAGQIYYTGYGYNVMTTDKVCVAQWLGEQGPENEGAIEGSSLADVSSIGKGDMEPRCSGDDMFDTTRIIEEVSMIRHSQSSSAIITQVKESSKKSKSARSSVSAFFARLRSGHRKASKPTIVTEDTPPPPSTRLSQPLFYSSTVDFCPRSSNATYSHVYRPCSLQSLSSSNIHRSQSSTSRISTQAIGDDSSSRCNSRTGRYKNRRSSKTEPVDNTETILDDSGIHSVSESRSKSPSRHRSSLTTLPTSEWQPRLPRSISTRLSGGGSLNPVLESDMWPQRDHHNDKHVLFIDDDIDS